MLILHGRLLLIPASAETGGHGTTMLARFWQKDLAALLASAPRLPQSSRRVRVAEGQPCVAIA